MPDPSVLRYGKLKSNNSGIISGKVSSTSARNYYVMEGESIARKLRPKKTYTIKGYVKLTIPEGGSNELVNVFYRYTRDGIGYTASIKEFSPLTPSNNLVYINETFTTNSECNGEFGFYTMTNGSSTYIEAQLFVFEGDYKGIPSVYFPGMMSVGSSKRNSEVTTIISTSKTFSIDNITLDTKIGEVNINNNCMCTPSIDVSGSVSVIDTINLVNKITSETINVYKSGVKTVYVPQGVYDIILSLNSYNDTITITNFSLNVNEYNGLQIYSIEDLSMNLLDSDKFIDNEKYNPDETATISSNNSFARNDTWISVTDNDTIMIYNPNLLYRHSAIHTICYNSEKKRISSIIDMCNAPLKLPSGTCYIRVYCNKSTGSLNSVSFDQFKQTKVCKTNISYKNIKYLDTDNKWKDVELRGIHGIADTIEKHSDGKYYYHKRCKNIDLSNHASITIDRSPVSNDNTHNKSVFQFKFEDIKNDIASKKPKCDKFIVEPYTYFNWGNINKEGIAWKVSHNKWITLIIDKSRLETDDVAGLRKWLSKNNVNIVVELDNEEVYECINLDINLFNNSTQILLQCGPVVPQDITFYTTSFIGNTIQSLKERVLLLENSLLDRATLHNRLMLSNRYSADRTKFNVDVVTLSANNRSCEIDVELIKLILSNISEGVLNYNRVWMEELIDFYTIIGIIPFEVADSLFELIESQYFEPSLDETL